METKRPRQIKCSMIIPDANHLETLQFLPIQLCANFSCNLYWHSRRNHVNDKGLEAVYKNQHSQSERYSDIWQTINTNLRVTLLLFTDCVYKGVSLTKRRSVQTVMEICHFLTPHVSVFKLRTLKPQLKFNWAVCHVGGASWQWSVCLTHCYQRRVT